jgi:hypothetical protein
VKILEETTALIEEITKVVDYIPPAQPKTIKLSDLMRYGARETPQAFGTWATPEGGTCALTAVFEGAKAMGLI